MLSMTASNELQPAWESGERFMPLSSLSPEQLLRMDPATLNMVALEQASQVLRFETDIPLMDQMYGMDYGGIGRSWDTLSAHVAPFSGAHYPIAAAIRRETELTTRFVGARFEEVDHVVKKSVAGNKNLQNALGITEADVDLFLETRIPAPLEAGKLLSGLVAIQLAPPGLFSGEVRANALTWLHKMRAMALRRNMAAIVEAGNDRQVRDVLAMQRGCLRRLEDFFIFK